MNDFPWHHFVHGDRPCKAALYMYESGVSGEPSDIYIKCETCPAKSCHVRRLLIVRRRPDLSPPLQPLQTPSTNNPAKTARQMCALFYVPPPIHGSPWFTPRSLIPGARTRSTHTLDALDIYRLPLIRQSYKVLSIPSIKADLGRYSLEEIWEKVTQKRNEGSVTVKPNDLKSPNGWS